MLSGNYNGVHTDGLVVLILHCNLRFSVGENIRYLAIFSALGKPFCQLVRQRYGQRHKFGGLVAGIAEHHSLITSACIQLVFLSSFQSVVNA